MLFRSIIKVRKERVIHSGAEIIQKNFLVKVRIWKYLQKPSYRHWSYPSQPNVVGVWLAGKKTVISKSEKGAGFGKHSDGMWPPLELQPDDKD